MSWSNAFIQAEEQTKQHKKSTMDEAKDIECMKE